MPEIVIADASCLILLDKIGRLSLLNRCYGKIFITPEIAKEFGDDLPAWIITQKPSDKNLLHALEQLVDKGEASALALALEKTNPLLVLDDLKARKVAASMKLKVTGTLGVIVKAKELGILKKVKPVLQELKTTDFRVAENIIQQVLKSCGE